MEYKQHTAHFENLQGLISDNDDIYVYNKLSTRSDNALGNTGV